MPDVVAQVRVLVEGSGLSQAAIGARTGLGGTTVWRWTRRHGWVRPAEAPRWTRHMAAERSGTGPRLVAGFARLAALADHEAVQPAAEAGGLAAGGSAEEPTHLRRIAAEARRIGRHIDRIAERDAPTLIRFATPRRDRPRGEDVAARARHRVEETVSRQSEIAARLGISKATLIGWKQQAGWVRPTDAPGRFGGAMPERERAAMERRIEARRRLGEAERLLDEIEAGRAAGTDALETALAALAAVRAALRAPPSRMTGPASVPDGGSGLRPRACGTFVPAVRPARGLTSGAD